MIPGSCGETPSDVLCEIKTLMAGLTGALEVQSSELLDLVDHSKLERHFERLVGDKPVNNTATILAEHLTAKSDREKGLGGVFDMSPAFKTLGFGVKVFANAKVQADFKTRKRNLAAALGHFTVKRQVAQLDDRERALVLAFAAMYVDGGLTFEQWCRFYSLMAWAGGKTGITAAREVASNPHLSDARKMLETILSAELPKHEVYVAAATDLLASYKAKSVNLARMIGEAVTRGARWFDVADFESSKAFTLHETPASLLVGYVGEEQLPLYFSGNESLITFGGPGAGKTQGQVIPNLLRYPGSAFVLDVKGELWEKTAEHRRRMFGPVYRFSPTGEGTARYNPFDCIAHEPEQAANDAQVFAAELIPDNPAAKDPYWDRKARDILWAFVTLVAISAPPEKRNLSEVSRYLSIPVSFDADPDLYRKSYTRTVVQTLRNLAKTSGLQDLDTTATAIEAGITSTRLESVFDSARSYLSSVTRSPTASAAMAASDWHPLDLRRTPGTTVYLTIKPGELRGFAPLVRVIFQQHATMLTRDFSRRAGEPPITFFLDEMPQLGLMPGLSDVMDLGRGAGLRLWMFAQYLGQMRALYDKRADGLVNACAVRCFMQPDLEAAQFIAPQLGNSTNLLTGGQQQLAEPHDLMGRAFADKIVTLARGEHPAWLSKVLACDEGAPGQRMVA